MEKIFRVLECEKQQKVSFATFMLKGETEFWWRASQDLLMIDDEESITWDMFFEAFHANYFLEGVWEEEVEFLELTQGNIMVLQYRGQDL